MYNLLMTFETVIGTDNIFAICNDIGLRQALNESWALLASGSTTNHLSFHWSLNQLWSAAPPGEFDPSDLTHIVWSPK